MPGRFSSYPLVANFTEIDDIKELREDMTEDYKQICEMAPGFKKYSVSEFMLVRSLVNSRIFGISIDGKPDEGIVPFAG